MAVACCKHRFKGCEKTCHLSMSEHCPTYVNNNEPISLVRPTEDKKETLSMGFIYFMSFLVVIATATAGYMLYKILGEGVQTKEAFVLLSADVGFVVMMIAYIRFQFNYYGEKRT